MSTDMLRRLTNRRFIIIIIISYMYYYYEFNVIVDSQLPKCTKTHVKLHIKCPKIVCGWGSSEPALTKNWIRCTHPECVVGRSSALISLGRGGGLYSVPPDALYSRGNRFAARRSE